MPPLQQITIVKFLFIMKKLLYILLFLPVCFATSCDDPYDVVEFRPSSGIRSDGWYRGEWLDLTIDGKKITTCEVMQESQWREYEYGSTPKFYDTNFHICDFPKKKQHITVRGTTCDDKFSDGLTVIDGKIYKAEAKHQMFPERRDSVRLTLTLTRYEH